MSSKQATKCELQKLKTLTESTEQWSRRVHKFWKSTTDVCLTACEAFQGDVSSATQFQTRLRDSAESVCQCVENVRDVAHTRYLDLHKSFQDKSKTKQSGSCKDLGRRMEYASVEISAAVFATFQTQADQLDQLTRSVLEFERDHLGEKSPVKKSGPVGEQTLETKKREISSDENNIQLDWDAFDRELAAVSEVVDKMGQESDCEQIQQLKRQLRQAQHENSQLMKRAILAEQALSRAEKDKSELKDQIDTGYNQDDFIEMRKALRKEQLARLEAEQRLRDAQEEIKAAQFAFKVAKAVANRIADSAEIAQGTLLRCQSERHIPECCPPIGNSTSAEIHTSSGPDVDESETEDSAPVPRSDSAFFDEEEPEQPPSNPFLDSTSQTETEPMNNPFIDSIPESESMAEAEVPNRPFLESPEGAAAQNPFCIEAPEKVEDSSNPFLLEGDAVKDAPSKIHSQSSPDDSSNPFLTTPSQDKTEIGDGSDLEEWNPFSAAASSNPFLT